MVRARRIDRERVCPRDWEAVVDDPDTGRDLKPTSRRRVWLVGDLDDAWVVSIAGALTESVARFHCPGDLPEGFSTPAATGVPSVVVLHRQVLTRHDAERVARLRAGRVPPPRVVLCFGPH